MKQQLIIAAITMLAFAASQCNESSESRDATAVDSTRNNKTGGFESQALWGQHLVTIAGCSDCHTPKKMTPLGPVPDDSLLLSGHPSKMPPPDINRKELERKGLAATNDMTAWAGPWGISYSGNLTPDETGIGNWTEEQFMRALREGKWKGLEGSRQLLPPMPWQNFRSFTDDEIKAIFAYLKSVRPIKNLVPPPVPPISAPKHN